MCCLKHTNKTNAKEFLKCIQFVINDYKETKLGPQDG